MGLQSVELLLDPAAEAAVVGEWRKLADAGLASQVHHTGETNRPHVTLTATPVLPEGVEQRLPGLVARRLPVPARLGALAVLGRDPVALVRLVVVHQALLDLHAAVADEVRPDPESFSAVGRWTPHVTLARRMPLAQVGAAVALLAPHGPASAFEAVRRWDGDQRRAWRLG